MAQLDSTQPEDPALFRLLIDSVKDYAIFVLDPQGIVMTWNAGAQRIKGYTPDEIIGQHFSCFYRPQDRSLCQHALEMAERAGRYENEGPRVRKGGAEFWASVTITALRDDSGRLVGFAKVTRDLTERVRMEQEQIRRARLEEAQQRKDEFLAIMGHELRNPLAPMVTAVHLIKARNPPGLDREIKVLDRQLKHMMRLVDDLLDVAGLLSGKFKMARRVVDVPGLLVQAIEVARPLIEKKAQHISTTFPPGGMLAELDADRMLQVFGNLLTNAAKYSPEGGHIRVGARVEGGSITVTFEDDGIGISRELLPRVFDLFTQAEQPLDRKEGGLGIGLAVAQRVVHGHGGEIRVESDGVGRGSRFIVSLPHARAGAAEDKSATPALGFALPRRVLLVDDDADSLEMLRTALAARGHQVQVAQDGPEALRLARDLHPQVVLLDLGMPNMDGYEVVQRMRRVPGCASIPIVALSGYARDTDRQQSRDAGFSDHLAKPVRVEAIIRLVEATPLT